MFLPEYSQIVSITWLQLFRLFPALLMSVYQCRVVHVSHRIRILFPRACTRQPTAATSDHLLSLGLQLGAFLEQHLDHPSPMQRRPTTTLVFGLSAEPFSSSTLTTASCPATAAHDCSIRS